MASITMGKIITAILAQSTVRLSGVLNIITPTLGDGPAYFLAKRSRCHFLRGKHFIKTILTSISFSRSRNALELYPQFCSSQLRAKSLSVGLHSSTIPFNSWLIDQRGGSSDAMISQTAFHHANIDIDSSGINLQPAQTYVPRLIDSRLYTISNSNPRISAIRPEVCSRMQLGTRTHPFTCQDSELPYY